MTRPVMRQNTDSPFIRGDVPDKLTGGHLDWMTIVSNAFSGACGEGNIKNIDGVVVGQYKAFCGLVMLSVSIDANTTIIMPSKGKRRIMMNFSDGQAIWADNDGNLTITVTNPVEGWGTYWG